MNLLFIKIWEHLELTFISLFFAMLIAIPLGIYLTRLKSERVASGIMRLTAMIQTIPGLALIALIVVTLAVMRAILPLPTTGFLPSAIVLVLYALMPILINTYTGIKQVSPSLKMVARSMGMTYRQIFFYVELPLSLPVLLTGVRIAFVTTVGMVTLTSLVGSGGLGDLIVQGLRTIQVDLVLAGTIPAALLAIIFDMGLLKLGRYLAAHT
ncbi:ABC transporter permease [Simkania sp.]|uniref:ABC transporter permease n=1 Tax=Simkania sp. TaxID=34094 RepID=UPI003B52A766